MRRRRLATGSRPFGVLAGLAALLLASVSPVEAASEVGFTLVVTNNRSLLPHRPNLQYADDDGARYVQVFRTITEPGHLRLLTRFDRPTAALYPGLVATARAPRRSELRQAVRELGDAVRAARAKGLHTVFYFVFAGHGQVERGKGYLELEDGRLGPEELEREVLGKVPAHRAHLILDSCNSFFVISPRKAGGRRWATPKDLKLGFVERFPQVGVFLSTSAAGEVYEWSELQSGIFSHEVRSGLSGAADANGDGRVSYDELAAFVAIANRRIKNEHFRPKVFARGPYQNGGASLFAVDRAVGRKLVLGPPAQRVWVRDLQGTRLLDVHKERGRELTLVLPMPVTEGAIVQELVAARGQGGRPTLREIRLPTSTASVMLTPRPAPLLARGDDALYEELFSEPFGPEAYAREREHPPAEEVFGISWRDEIRMRHYLAALARADRAERLTLAGTSALGGLVVAASGGVILGMKSGELDQTTKISAIVLLGGGGALAATGLLRLFARSEGEKAYAAFEDELRRPGASFESVVARTEAHLLELAEREARRRRLVSALAFVEGGLLLGATVAIGIVDARSAGTNIPAGIYVMGGAMSALLFGLGVALRTMETPMERMLRLYREDPDLNLNLAFAPTPGGGMVGVTGTF